MPGRDGTGPAGTGPTGRRMGPCRGRGFPARNETQTDVEKAETPVEQPENQPVVYGVGRGGRPRGCGMGRCGGRRGN
jgi:hypothetical protein